jgi:hypothetical protein
VGIESDSPAYVNTVCPSWLRFLSHMHRCFMPTLPTTTLIVHLRDFMILPFGRAVKSDLQRISLSAVSTDGLYFSTNVPVIVVKKGDPPIRLADFEKHIGPIDPRALGSDQQILDYMCHTLKSHNPKMTPYTEMFLELYFGILKASITDPRRDPTIAAEARAKIGLLHCDVPCHVSKTDVWRALLPIPELQFYVREPLSHPESYQPDINRRVDYGFWDGQKWIAVEIDGTEPAGYERDVRRDRQLKEADLDVRHILNSEILQHKGRALWKYLPRNIFGFDWNYKSECPDFAIPF